MQFSNEIVWNDYQSKNSQGYGRGIMTFAERWANLMEERSPDGFNPEVARAAESDADTEGISGFMYGAAVATLSVTWIYGEDLRKWHNGEYGVPADASGVVNPAILNYTTSEGE